MDSSQCTASAPGWWLKRLAASGRAGGARGGPSLRFRPSTSSVPSLQRGAVCRTLKHSGGGRVAVDRAFVDILVEIPIRLVVRIIVEKASHPGAGPFLHRLDGRAGSRPVACRCLAGQRRLGLAASAGAGRSEQHYAARGERRARVATAHCNCSELACAGICALCCAARSARA